ncbi:hypothetical protein ETI06_09620 [Macrococcoides goetzii]|nr:hypothetical protein [Macrococcus goetzii]TDM48723.1 hypothetical protein ETI06_09620 [Macrococcus goetzii]
MKKYNLQYLKQQVAYGKVQFEINNAVIKDIPTTHGNMPVISMDITLIDQHTKKSDKLSNYLLFINDNPKSEFGQFVKEYVVKIDETGFNNSAELIGIKGTVDYYVNNKGYETLSRWNLTIPSSVAQAHLINHVKGNTSINEQLQPYFENLNAQNYSGHDNFITSFHTDANVPENTVNNFDFECAQDADMEDNDYV